MVNGSIVYIHPKVLKTEFGDLVTLPPGKGIALVVGDSGYRFVPESFTHEEELPIEVQKAAISGSMFGWHCPAAKPAMDYIR